MRVPAYKLTIGGKVVDTTGEPRASTLVGLTVALDLDTPADGFTLVLGNADGLKPARDDKAAVELGYADDGALTQVMTGTVATVEPGLATTRVIGIGGAAALLRGRVEQTYEGHTAGSIVRDLAGQAGLDVATAEDGISFPAYVVDGRRSLARHLRDLADLCGFDTYVNSDGALVFERFTRGKAVHVLEYAKHLLELDLLHAPPAADLVEAWGESPGSEHGATAWAWLTRDFTPSKGSAGSGTAKLLLERPALRTADAARAAAEAALTAIRRRTTRGRLVAPGLAAARLGDAVRLQGVPDDRLNGTFQLRAVTHQINKASGFTTTIEFRGIQA
jgi:phage protein D